MFKRISKVSEIEQERTMDLMDAIYNRRAVRDFEDTSVGQSVIHSLLSAAIAAPSAMNQQPWAFSVCLHRKRVEELANRARTWLLENPGEAPAELSLHDTLNDPEFAIFHHAPALVIVLAKSSGTQAAEDCCLAAENLMLAARNAGLGTCWIGLSRPWLDLPSTKLELGVPETYHVVAPIVLGQPTEWPEPQGRKPAEIRWIR
jgi:nitroreductase